MTKVMHYTLFSVEPPEVGYGNGRQNKCPIYNRASLHEYPLAEAQQVFRARLTEGGYQLRKTHSKDITDVDA